MRRVLRGVSALLCLLAALCAGAAVSGCAEETAPPGLAKNSGKKTVEYGGYLYCVVFDAESGVYTLARFNKNGAGQKTIFQSDMPCVSGIYIFDGFIYASFNAEDAENGATFKFDLKGNTELSFEGVMKLFDHDNRVIYYTRLDTAGGYVTRLCYTGFDGNVHRELVSSGDIFTEEEIGGRIVGIDGLSLTGERLEFTAAADGMEKICAVMTDGEGFEILDEVME